MTETTESIAREEARDDLRAAEIGIARTALEQNMASMQETNAALVKKLQALQESRAELIDALKPFADAAFYEKGDITFSFTHITKYNLLRACLALAKAKEVLK